MTNFIKASCLLAIVLGASALPGAAQRSADFKKSGDFYYTTGDYFSAATYYQQYLDGSKGGSKTTGGFHPYAVSLQGAKGGKSTAGAVSDAEVQFRLAESYRHLNDHSNAAKAYENLLKSKDAANYKEARLHYAMALRASGKPAEAKAQLEQYLQSGGTNTAAAQRELQAIAFAETAMKDPNARQYTIARMADPVNSAETNYAASWSNGNLVFTSTRPDTALQAKGKNAFANRIYTGTVAGPVSLLPIASADGMEQGAASMSPDGNRIYFTRWSYDRGVPASQIYMSQKSGSGWSEPVKLGGDVNNGGNSKQPFVSPDGKYLLFASDRGAGMGGYDLYSAPIGADGQAGSSMNMGNGINTSEDEEAPFYHAPSQTLVFASRGHMGLGGLDLYTSKGSLGGSWAAPQNMGFPVNSNKDESYFSTNSPDRLLKGAMLSSDRGDGACMSLYSADKQYHLYISGKVIDCATQQPLAGARVQLDGRSAQTANDGSYVVEISAPKTVGVQASKEGYENGSVQVAAPSADQDTLEATSICLKAVVPPTPETPVVEAPAQDNTVLFDFAKYSLRAETQVTLDTLAAILKRETSLRVVVTGYTDQVGSEDYNLKLSRDRAEACAEYLKRKGVAASRVQVVAKGACCPLQPEKTSDGQDIPEARQKNRRVEFDIKLLR
jgi:OOP family OmpA-OmpF porin